MSMTNRERFRAVMQFQSVDRLPVIEWAPWWDLTLQRWRQEGLPSDLTDPVDLARHLQLDPTRQVRLRATGGPVKAFRNHITSDYDYDKIHPTIFPAPEYYADKFDFERCAYEQNRDDVIVWITMDGFFWLPRVLFGVENHLYAFYEQQDLMHRVNQDLVSYNLRLFEHVFSHFTPDFVTFAEDMSYNNGPMISRELFDEFMAPYYQTIVPILKEHDVTVIVDSDGEISSMLPWFLDAGVDAFLPLERQAGCDLTAMRGGFPSVRFIGAFDKTIMHVGEQALRDEFERLFPVMVQGGYIPSIDHQTPPAVSLADYQMYVRLLREYARLAGKEMRPHSFGTTVFS